MTKGQILKFSKKPVGIGAIFAVLGGGGFGGYKAVRDFIIGPILVNMKGGEVRENEIISNQKKLLHYEELKLRLQYRPDDIKAVKKEIATENFWVTN